jgi:hypothetical protein
MLRRITALLLLFLFTGLLMLKDKLIIGKPYNVGSNGAEVWAFGLSNKY